MSSTTLLRELFGAKLSDADLVKAAADFRMAVETTPNTQRGDVELDVMNKALVPTVRGNARQVLTKAYGNLGVSADKMAAVEAAVAQQLGADWLQKDITPTSPVPGGLVGFDLRAPALLLAPILTPMRNKFPRTQGMGTSYRYKRVTGISGSGTGGLGAFNPGFTDPTQVNFANPGSANPLWWNRPQKISYAGDDTNLSYVQMGASDEQSFWTYFSAMGFQDTRELSRMATLYASMLAEERVMLYGRGTLQGYSGLVAAPSGTPTGAARNAATGETALTGFTSNVYVRVVAESGEFGVSQASSASSGIAVSAGQVVDITIPNPVTGTTGYKVFVSTGASDPGDASRYLYVGPAFPSNQSAGRTPTQTLTLQGAIGTPGSGSLATATVAAWPIQGGATVNLATGDGVSARPDNYDGIIPWIWSQAATTGYVGRLNAPFSTASPGAEFQAAFAATYAATKADPEEIWLSGQDRHQISSTLRGQSASNYRLEISEDQLMGVKLGSVVTSIVNETTGRSVDIKVHPWMPQGNAVVLQSSITVPGVNVANCWEIRGPQDYMSIDWPVMQMSYDTSVYWTSTMAAYAPDRSSMIVGIQPTS